LQDYAFNLVNYPEQKMPHLLNVLHNIAAHHTHNGSAFGIIDNAELLFLCSGLVLQAYDRTGDLISLQQLFDCLAVDLDLSQVSVRLYAHYANLLKDELVSKLNNTLNISNGCQVVFSQQARLSPTQATDQLDLDEAVCASLRLQDSHHFNRTQIFSGGMENELVGRVRAISTAGNARALLRQVQPGQPRQPQAARQLSELERAFARRNN
jgi:hypothetical protein